MDYTPFKTLLLNMKAEASVKDEDVEHTFKAEQAADELDAATQANASALAKRLLERQALYVRRIDESLQRIENETYGECEGCGEMISEKRLMARPVAVLCILCKERQEKQEKLRNTPGRGFTALDEE
jgi:DnaK suppressor protein